MKFNALKLAALVAAVPAVATAGVTVTPQVTYQTFDNIAKDTAIPQLGLGYRFDNGPLANLALDLVIGAGKAEIVRSRNNRFASPVYRTARKNTDVTQFRVDAKYFLPVTAGPLELYTAAGIGQIMLKGAEIGSIERAQDSKGDYMTLNLGGGAQYGLTKNLNAVFDARYLNWKMGDGMGGDNNVDDSQFSLGLQYDFGSAAPVVPVIAPPKPQPVKRIDSDGDGVPDDIDQCPGTPRNYAVDSRGCPRELVKPVSIPLRVLFDTNKSFIKPQYQGEVAKVANFMKQYPTATTVVEGHTDSRGSAKYNQRLSQRRANAVKMALINKYGVNPARVRAVGYGEAKPVATNKTKAGRAQNRRVVAVVSGKKKVIQQR